MTQVSDTIAEERPPREGSLKPVIDAIPASAYENPTWKGMAYALRDAGLYLGLLVALVFVSNVWAVIGLEVVMALVVSGLFIIGHDSAHGALFRSKKLNSAVGRIAMLPSFHVFEGWILGHNRVHHAFTVRQGYDFVWHPTTPQEWNAKGRLSRLVHRFEWSWMGSGTYYLHQVWAKKMMVGKPPSRWTKAIYRDRGVVWGFIAVMIGLFTVIGVLRGLSVAGILWLDARTVLLPFLGFAYVMGSFVHVHHVAPEIRWWPKAQWTKFKAQMEGTTVLRAPKGLNFFIHWIMVHVPHHVDMRVPMYNLEEAAEAIEAAFPGTVIDDNLRFRDFVRNTRACKLYDFDAGRWMTYREGRAASLVVDAAA